MTVMSTKESNVFPAKQDFHFLSPGGIDFEPCLSESEPSNGHPLNWGCFFRANYANSTYTDEINHVISIFRQVKGLKNSEKSRFCQDKCIKKALT